MMLRKYEIASLIAKPDRRGGWSIDDSDLIGVVDLDDGWGAAKIVAALRREGSLSKRAAASFVVDKMDRGYIGINDKRTGRPLLTLRAPSFYGARRKAGRAQKTKRGGAAGLIAAARALKQAWR